jgi:hypothetical protein
MTAMTVGLSEIDPRAVDACLLAAAKEVMR